MDDTRNILLKRTVPIVRIVHAAIIDMHEDIGRTQEVFLHWAARGFKKMNDQYLMLGKRKVLLDINPNTNTATLPSDFHVETFVGPIILGRKFEMPLRSNLVDLENIEELEDEGNCPRCGIDKCLCNDIMITQDNELVAIGDLIANKTTIRKVYPNGDVYLEITTPVLDIATNLIDYVTTKEYITKLDMAPCGCPDLTENTLLNIQNFCPDLHCKHFTPCQCNIDYDLGGYQIFEETGLIKFSRRRFRQVYMEYIGFLPKRNGQFHVPELFFESLVEYIKFKWVRNKGNVPKWERDQALGDYQRELDNMEQKLCRIPLSTVKELVTTVPKFDINIPYDHYHFHHRLNSILW